MVNFQVQIAMMGEAEFLIVEHLGQTIWLVLFDIKKKNRWIGQNGEGRAEKNLNLIFLFYKIVV